MSSPPELEFRPPPNEHFGCGRGNGGFNALTAWLPGGGGLNSSSGGELKLYLKGKRNTACMVAGGHAWLPRGMCGSGGGMRRIHRTRYGQ